LAVVATVLGVGAGTLLGVVSGYSRGWPDEGIMRSLDVVLSFPAIVLGLLLLSMAGAEALLIVVAICATHTPLVARAVRAATLQIVEQDYIQYAETIGTPRRRIVLHEIIPNITAPLTVECGLRFTYSIGLVAALAYLGFGTPPPHPDWGVMINENQIGLT